jgi:anti-sigma B factor antagonist
MPTSESRLKVKRDGAIVEVGFRDRNILDEANIQQIGDEIKSIIDSAPSPKLIINFSDVDHLSSAALGTLITVNHRIRASNGQLRLCHIDPQIYQVFVITKLNKLFQIHETSEKARASIK